MARANVLQRTLLELLSNTLILYQTCPYLPISGLLNLAAASRSFQSLIYDTANVFRYLDLSSIKGGAIDFAPIDRGGEIWRSERMDEAVTEEDFYCGPLRGIFSSLKRKRVLQDVHTLILDGLTCPAELIREIICDEPFNVRILSLRDVKHLNKGKLQQIMKYVVRPSRPEGSPKLKGLYLVSRGDDPSHSPPILRGGTHLPSMSGNGVTTSIGAQLGSQWNQRSISALSSSSSPTDNPWYQASGASATRNSMYEWNDMIIACQGIIAFDMVLCRGPRHDVGSHKAPLDPVDSQTLQNNFYLPRACATVVLGPTGCQICHSIPEGPAIPGESSPDHLPLLDPLPRHSSSVSAAQIIPSRDGSHIRLPLFARCVSCLSDRWCEGCNKFWCESCYRTSESSTYTQMQKIETSQVGGGTGLRMGIKVHLGLCIEDCLVGEMYNGAGSGGMWG